MTIFDDIANIRTARPLTAFLVGRRNREDRLRQDRLLALQERNIGSLIETREGQLELQQDILRGNREAAEEGARTEALQLRARKAAVLPQLDKARRGGLIDDQTFGVLASRVATAPNMDSFESAMDDIDKFLPKPRQQIEQGAPGDFDTRGREGKAARDAIRAQNEATDNALGEFAIAIERNRNAPGAAGVPGRAQEVIAGTVGQIPGVGDALTDAAQRITGVDETELARIRTQARTLIAASIPTIVGDDSGRYTKEEQDITRQTLAQLNSFRTTEQIEGALTEVQAIKLRGELRKRKEEFLEHVMGAPVDLATAEGQDAWGNQLLEFGLDREQAFEELVRHMEILGVR